MKSKIKSIEECASLLEIEVQPKMVEKALEEIYEEITKSASIPGFRAGHAPKDLVRKHYSGSAREEVLKRLITESYKAALAEHGISPISLPDITDVKFEDDNILLFKARVDTRPKFKLKEYKGISIKKKKIEITEDDVKKTLENLREINARYIDAGDRPVQEGDYVIGDLECEIDAKPIHKKRENIWLSVDKMSLMPDVTGKMVGMKKGEEREIEAKLPEKYPDKNSAGKLAKFKVKAKDIKIRQLPGMDDEFAKDLGKKTLEEVRSEIRREMEARAAQESETDAENQVLKKLTDDNVFAVPSSLVKRQLVHMVEDAKRRLLEKGLKKEELDKKDAEFEARFKDEAGRKVRLLFILDEISAKEKIDVTDEDLEGAYVSIASQANSSTDEIKAYYEKENIVENLKDRIRESKTVQFLVKSAEIAQ